ncbi:hypothetical protein EK21DRAFT_74216 [Setomelanomma holmii]|uniref:Uncharacterized protein n=1 Tax=Setomelanomma holmii TaxID=210430 RepID=A0A9P4H4C2_9PLEO|nr:hypothetical protein EK21DRAFT_74216 [Setomelanomma holmii]
MRVLNFSTPQKSRYRPVITTFLLLLCIPIFFYHLVPSFTHATDDFMASITTRIRGQKTSRGEFCTKKIGDAQCCNLYLDASPCIDECRKQHVDRVSYILTKEYDQCADRCLATYNSVCQRADNGKSLEGTKKGS